MKKGLSKYIGYIVSTLTTTMLAFPLLVSAQDFYWVTAMIAGIETVITYAVPVLVALALLLFIWGVVVFILNSADEKARGEGKQKMIWGVIALFVIVSVWGLVLLLQEITGIDGNAGSLAPPAIL